jgi:poly[(R)-3-hydroxyalkanoate] polymerase subunit PhaC
LPPATGKPYVVDDQPVVPILHTVLEQLDHARRRTGRLLDGVGVGPRETPSEVVAEVPGVRLRHFPGATGAPPVLLVPAPIKRWYIWDLEPAVSVVRRCLAYPLDVHLVEWTDGGDAGLDAYAGRMLRTCIDALTERTGHRRVPLIGHSLGGTLAAVFAARHPEAVRRIVLLEAPLHFGADAGAFAPLLAMSPPVRRLADVERPVPGSFLDLVSMLADPVAFQLARYADLALSLGDRGLLATHLRVLRWTLDELPLAGHLFEDVVERLYRRDEFMTGTLSITGRAVGPADLTAPLLTVLNPYSRVIPPESIVPFHRAAGGSRKQLIRYRGDRGVALQHVGMLVGRNAHQFLWPQLLDWLTTDS